MKRTNLEFKLKLEKFVIEGIWQYLIVIAFLSFCAWLFDKPIEAVLFCVAHIVIRRYCDKQYHCGKTAICMIVTLSIGFFGILSCLPLSVSLLSTIPVCFLICIAGYFMQDRVDNMILIDRIQKENKRLLESLNDKSHPDIYKMSEDELRQYGASKQLSELQQDILIFRIIEHLRISEICDYRNYGRTTIKYHIKEIKKKLNIDKI